MPSTLRCLFVVLLVFCSPSNPRNLWKTYEHQLSADFVRLQNAESFDSYDAKIKTLSEINRALQQMGKSLADFQLLLGDADFRFHEKPTREIEFERNIQVSEEDLMLVSKLNKDQKQAYNVIMESIRNNTGQSFFLDGPGGTGKTFLYRALLATVRSQGFTAIAVATSGVAASILPGGRTAHSRFKIPLDFASGLTCNLSKQSNIAKLIIQSRLILWDEASMARKEGVEAFDALLKDLMNSHKPFGGKIVVFGGDFRQTLQVIEKATKNQQISSSLVNSTLWPDLKKLMLTENMRAKLDPTFSQFLLQIGEGKEPVDTNGHVCLPENIVIPYIDKEVSLNRLIDFVFFDLNMYSIRPLEMVNRCILAPKNNAVDDINGLMIEHFPGTAQVYTSVDKAVDEKHQGDYDDFFNTLNPNGLPPHKLLLKKNCPVILLRNLNPLEGLCNGTRLICRELRLNSILVEIAVGQHKGKTFFLPKIPPNSNNSGNHDIPFIRTQFPVKLCFAMTINKAQGQTLDFVGIYLREPVFSHGQLYVALSRAKTSDRVRVLIVPPTFSDVKTDCRTRNVVFHEIFNLAQQ